MEVINEVMSSDPQRLAEMAEKGPEGPIFMINLLKFKDKAEYEDGRETDLTGRQAYQIYGAGVSQLITEYDGRILFMADVILSSMTKIDGPY